MKKETDVESDVSKLKVRRQATAHRHDCNLEHDGDHIRGGLPYCPSCGATLHTMDRDHPEGLCASCARNRRSA